MSGGKKFPGSSLGRGVAPQHEMPPIAGAFQAVGETEVAGEMAALDRFLGDGGYDHRLQIRSK